MSRTNAPQRPHCYRKPLRPALSQHPRTTTALQVLGGAGDGILRAEFPTWQTLEPDTTDDDLD